MANHLIRWGILGTSYISEVMAAAIHESGSGELTAIASRSRPNARKFAKKYSITKAYDDYEALINDADIDAIYIALPNHLHKEWIIRSAQAGKHILCEKPFVISANEAHEVISILDQTSVFCMEALMYRCHPFTKKLQEVVRNKTIGDIKLYNATYTANITEKANPTAGGSIRNLGCYPVSLVRLLAGAEPIETLGMGRLNPINHNDSQASVILKFADDSMAVVSTADDIEMFWQFDIYSTEGSLQVTTNPWLPDCTHNEMIIYRNGEKDPLEINVTAEKSLYSYQIDTMGACIKEGNFTNHDGISLADSLGNITVLETWLEQVKGQNLQLKILSA